jgi:hypothetical protein
LLSPKYGVSINKKTMKHLKLHLSAAYFLTILAIVGYAQQDRLYDPNRNECLWFFHPGGCHHKYPANPGMCWRGPGGNGVAVCPGQDNQANCEADGKYFVHNNFDQDEPFNSTATCTDSSNSFQIWAQHTKISSPDEQCYRPVTCKWDDQVQPNQCVVDSGGVWQSLPKKTSNLCP